MEKNLKESKIRILKFRIPKFCVCPDCKTKQHFKKEKEHYKTVKDMNLEQPQLFKVRMVYAKCLNPDCTTHSFALPTQGIEKYSRATNRLKNEAIAGLIEDNSTCPRIAKRLNRSFNTTASRSTIDSWKHKEAEKHNFKDIIPKLNFSGILYLDEYKPKRAKTYELICGDAINGNILYIQSTGKYYGYGEVGLYLEKLKELGINPWACVIDFFAAFPKQLKKLWPDIIIQYDYFHIQQWIHKFLKNAILHYRRELKEKELKNMSSELWEHKWRLLKNMDKWTPKDHQIIEALMETYKGTIIEKVLIFKEQLWDIFDNSTTKKEAYEKRNSLAEETWWRDSSHFVKIMNFLMSWKFEFMITYLQYPKVPRTGNENIIRIWRQMEKVRYGFKTEKGRQNHLKLLQIRKYLNEK